MLRTSALGALVTVRISVVACAFAVFAIDDGGHTRCSAQTLPSQRLELPDSGAVAHINLYTFIGDQHYPSFDSSDANDAVNDTSVWIPGAAGNIDNYLGYAMSQVTASTYIGIATNAWDVSPYIDTTVQIQSDTEVGTADEGDHWWSNFILEGLYADGDITCVIGNAPDYPDAGVARNSATMTVYLYFLATGPSGPATGDTSVYGNVLEARVGTSRLVANPLDASGQNWEVTGLLDQSTSTNPTAAPANIDDAYFGGINQMYVGSKATNVGVQVPVRARVDLQATIQATNLDPAIPSATDQRSLKTTSYYSVNVP